MIPIYNNFDSLHISFQGAVPEHIRKQLREAKEQAQKDKNAVPIKLGANKYIVSVGETGAKGGYTFVFNTEVDGETWLISDSSKTDQWNLKVSVRSLNLALRGYKKTKEKILDFLFNELEATIKRERISRFDYCVDFKTDKFELIPQHIFSHNKSKRSYNLSNDFVISGTARTFESVRIGTMPNRQIAIYNKTKEIIASKKNYWWNLWKIEKDEFKGQIWRIEIRAGKKELNSWGIRKFEDLENKAGDVILSILNSIKYVIPNENDSNSSRWPNAPFWNDLIKIIKGDLFEYISNAEREEVLIGIRRELEIIIKKQIAGNCRSYTALTGQNLDQLPGVMDVLSGEIIEDHKNNKEFEIKKFEKSVKRYKLLQ